MADTYTVVRCIFNCTESVTNKTEIEILQLKTYKTSLPNYVRVMRQMKK